MTMWPEFESPTQRLCQGTCMIYRGSLTRDEVARAAKAKMRPSEGDDLGLSLSAMSEAIGIEGQIEEIVLEPGVSRSALGLEIGRALEQGLDAGALPWKLVLFQGLACGNTVLLALVQPGQVGASRNADLSRLDLATLDLPTLLNDLTPASDPTPARRRLGRAERQFESRIDSGAGRSTETPPSEQPESERAEGETAPPESSRTAPFRGTLSGKLDFGAVELSFTEMRHLRSELRTTVTDLAHAALSGGLGGYLRGRGVGTEGLRLHGSCPGQRRSIVPLHVGIEDPLARLALEQREKAEPEEMPRSRPIDLLWMHRPGPQIPLYLGGHQLLSCYPVMPVSGDLGLSVAVQSYNKKLTIGLTVDPVVVPDVWQLAESIEKAYGELFAATIRSSSEGWAPSVVDLEPSRNDVFPSARL